MGLPAAFVYSYPVSISCSAGAVFACHALCAVPTPTRDWRVYRREDVSHRILIYHSKRGAAQFVFPKRLFFSPKKKGGGGEVEVGGVLKKNKFKSDVCPWQIATK
jgi:hypothetical protein